MSSTRRVAAGARRRQDGWASSPEYDVLRGLNGTAVAFKAALQDSAEKRALLFFLQALSLRDGGTKRIARELVAMFPERIGSPTMHKLGCQPGTRLTPEQSRQIRRELASDVTLARMALAEYEWDDLKEIFGAPVNRDSEPVNGEPEAKTGADFLAECRRACAESLDGFIEALCCNPKLEVSSQAASDGYESAVRIVLDDAQAALERDPRLARERPDLHATVSARGEFTVASLPYFQDVLGALFEYQRRHAADARAGYVETSIGKIVFEAMDYVLETGRSALIEGHSGYGKTTALKAWCEMHLGQARYVELSGIMSRSIFFRTVAKALGVANGGGMSSVKIQARVEDFLQRTKLMLVIDEAQYLWPQTKRVETHPELINWLNTACYNKGVPFVLSATKQFTLRRQVVERQTDWSSEQSRRRTRKVFPLPDAPTEDDLLAVARHLLGNLGEAAVEYVAGYAISSRGYFQTITDAVEDAQLLTRRAGRDRITVKDLKMAIQEWRAPSDAALQRVFDSAPETKRRGARREAQASVEPPVSMPIIEPLNSRLPAIGSDGRGPQASLRSVRPLAEAVPAG